MSGKSANSLVVRIRSVIVLSAAFNQIQGVRGNDSDIAGSGNGDFGGGGMLLTFGIVAALHERNQSGKGQVIDAAMTEASSLLMNGVFGGMSAGSRSHDRGTNLLDDGAHFYNTYETSDGKWVSIGSIEPQFYALLLEKSGLGEMPELPKQHSRDDWPGLKDQLTRIFKSKTRDEWDEIMLGTDPCYAPILNFDETRAHPHNAARASFVEQDGIHQAAPAPKFSRTEPILPPSSVAPGARSIDILQAANFSAEAIEALTASGAIVQAWARKSERSGDADEARKIDEAKGGMTPWDA